MTCRTLVSTSHAMNLRSFGRRPLLRNGYRLSQMTFLE